MIYFTAEEIFGSVLHASVYGLLFSVFLMLLSLFMHIGRTLLSLPDAVFRYDKIFSRPTVTETKSVTQPLSGAGVFLEVVLFSMGFILLSYYSLDGVFRVYMLVVSLAIFFISRKLIFDKIYALASKLFKLLFCILVFLMRIVVFPLSRALRALMHKKTKKDSL